MLTKERTEIPLQLCKPVTNKDDRSIAAAKHRPNNLRLRIRIPIECQQEPIISKLVSRHGLTVNVKAASFDSCNTHTNDCWFELELQGMPCQIDSGLIYLEELDIDISILSDPLDIEDENW